MLSIPSGFNPSVSAHNIRDATFLDWVETTTLIEQEELSPTDIVDCLVEEQLYEDQGFASEYVMLKWDDLRVRLSWLGLYSPICFHERRMVRRWNWMEIPAYSFCMTVSFGPQYPDWVTKFGSDYTEQGELFELITEAAMKVRFCGWQFLHTGWRRDTVSKLPEVINNLTSHIGERIGLFEDYASDQANEAGVDLVWHLPFADRRGGTPVYLAQCASGKNWKNKIHEPDLEVWTKIVDFAGVPNKAFSLPFSLEEKELRQQSNRAQGLLLDRYRLLAHGIPENEWISATLRSKLIDWLEPRIDWLKSK